MRNLRIVCDAGGASLFLTAEGREQVDYLLKLDAAVTELDVLAALLADTGWQIVDAVGVGLTDEPGVVAILPPEGDVLFYHELAPVENAIDELRRHALHLTRAAICCV
jgi:hypothetical protein